MSSMTLAATRPATHRPLVRGVFTDLGYLLPGLFLAIPAFVIFVTGFCLGVSTAIIWIGPWILLATFACMRGFANVERRLAAWRLGSPLPPHIYRDAGRGGFRGVFRRLGDPQRWRDGLHGFLILPIRCATWSLSVAWTSAAVGGTLYVLWEWSLPRDDPEAKTLLELMIGNDSRAGDIALTTAEGLFCLLTLPWVLRLCAGIGTSLAKGLLTNENAALRARTEQLSASRAAAVQAEAQTLRRVERDLHDGPQQRLVRLAMDLEAAQRRLDDDPEAAGPLVAGALEQSREALAEIRAVSRGIAPPILVDRGLGPALAAAAARCPVQVSLDVAIPSGQRLPEAVESTAYFVVSEGLTNVAKHSGATLCSVQVARVTGTVTITVSDDGAGGAHPGKGHGLAGLADRLATVDGRLDLSSPVGGPTILRAEIPVP